jgi:hypothetical protein
VSSWGLILPDVLAAFRAHHVETTREALDNALMSAIKAIGPISSAAISQGLSHAEIEALESVGATAASLETVEKVTIDTSARFAALIASSLTTARVATLLGVSVGRVRQKVGQVELYRIDDPSGPGHLFPRFQFDHGRPLPGLAKVLAATPQGVHPLALETFFVAPDPDLDARPEAAVATKDEYTLGNPLSPRQWLLSGGDPGAVAALAAEL